tara:strand:- start:294 stop:599 length:306 start_codon:yes stop_codon:yes gene_type:complete
MKIPKDERKAIDNKKCFPNKRVEEMFWAYADEVLDMDTDVKHRDIYAMLETAFKEGYKKGFASAEAYVSEKELYQELADEWEQMVKNDTHEEIYESRKEVK